MPPMRVAPASPGVSAEPRASSVCRWERTDSLLSAAALCGGTRHRGRQSQAAPGSLSLQDWAEATRAKAKKLLYGDKDSLIAEAELCVRAKQSKKEFIPCFLESRAQRE